MAEPESLNKPHPEVTSQARPKPRKSCTALLCKSLFVALLLVLLPLFPSRAPEFIKQNLITKLWELLHLLFIGIVVSYGLFGRRNPEIDSETQSHLDHSRAYSSEILHVSSIFEDGFENPFGGSDENKLIQTWNSQHLESESQAGSSIHRNPRSLIFENGSENQSGSDQKMVNQTWNSQYYHVESMVVFHQDNRVLDELGKPKSIIDYKPLGLPVRSLRSRIADDETPESVQGNGSSSGSKDSSKNSDRSSNGEIRGLTPVNLEEKFEETVALPSPIPWRSRSSRMKVTEDMGNHKPPKHSSPQLIGEDVKTRVKPPSTGEDMKTSITPPSDSRPLSVGENTRTTVKPPSDSRPLSVGEDVRTTVKPPSHSRPPSRSKPLSVGECSGASVKPHSHSRHLSIQEDKGASVKPPPSHSRPLSVGQFELDDHLNSQSFWSSIFSQASCIPSPKKELPSPTVSPEVPADSKMEDLERKKNSRRSSSLQASQPESALRNGEASYTRRFSIGSLSEMNEQSSLKDFSKSVRDDPLRKGKWRMDSFNTDVKPTSPLKPLPRGKSVRTIRAREHALNAPKMGDICSDHMDEKMGKTCDKFKTISAVENKGRRSRLEQQPKNPRKNLDDNLPLKQTQKLSKYEDEEKQDFAETVAVKSEKDSESEFENFQVSSDEEEAQSNIFSGAELDPDEVDRKAGEFKVSSHEEAGAAQSDIAEDDEAQYDIVDNAEHDHDNEVDRKAGEFIAKFREQIRLQKLHLSSDLVVG